MLKETITVTQTHDEEYDYYGFSNFEEEQLTHLQEIAIDLYKRGFNVFPVRYGDKKPFEGTPIRKLFNSRLHLCKGGIYPCRHERRVPPFLRLFAGRKNIAVMCGKTSGNLLALDCDSRDAYQYIGSELDNRGLPYWSYTSSRGGCYLLRVTEGETVNLPKGKGVIQDLEVWGNCHYAILPPSVHPSGEVYRWRGDTEPRFHFAGPYETLPSVSITTLEWLGVILLKDNNNKQQKGQFDMFGLPEKYTVLSKRNREMLANGTTEGERNNRLYSLACDLVGNQFDWEEVEEDFLRAAQICKPAYPIRDAQAVLKSAYTEERTPARKNQAANELNLFIQRLYSFATSYDWKGRFGRKARLRKQIFLACVRRAQIEGETFRASVRELAEDVNRNYQFVHLCLKDLCDANLLRLVLPAKKSSCGANVYCFGVTVTDSEYFTVSYTCNNNVAFSLSQKQPKTDAEKDVFKRLGSVAWDVWQYLQTNVAPSKNAIAKATGLPQSSVSAAVNRLITCDLVIYSQAEGLYFAEAVSHDELFSLSIKLKSNGSAEMRRIGHTIDREIYLNRKLYMAVRAVELAKTITSKGD